MNTPQKNIGTCYACDKGVPYYIYETDWMFEAEPVFPCNNCGRGTCGEHVVNPRYWRDGDGGTEMDYDGYECGECLDGGSVSRERESEYAGSRGV